MRESRETCFKTLRPLGLCSIFPHNALSSPDAQDKITKLLTKAEPKFPHTMGPAPLHGGLGGRGLSYSLPAPEDPALESI